jgi:hypothetical protein
VATRGADHPLHPNCHSYAPAPLAVRRAAGTASMTTVWWSPRVTCQGKANPAVGRPPGRAVGSGPRWNPRGYWHGSIAVMRRLQTHRPGCRRLLVVVVIAALFVVIPTARFADRVGGDLSGDAGGHLGMGVAAVAVLALAGGVGYLLTMRRL